MVFEDRVAKYPGRWTMVKSDGTSEIVILVRNDEPIKEGTPINASTLNELSTVAGAINAKDEAVAAAQTATSERAKAEQAATNAANEVKADLKEYSDNAASSAAAAATSESNAKASETESAKNLQGTKEYFEQVRTITIGAQGWYATPEALKAAVPVGENGWWAVVGTTDTIWTWDGDTGAWVDTRKEVDLSDYLTQDQIKKLLEQYMPLRPATATTLGGIKSGKGLKISADGTASIDAYNTAETDSLLNALQKQVDRKISSAISSATSITASGDGYIRFSDGTQICWLKFGEWPRKEYNPYFQFPVPFANTNYGAGYAFGKSITYSSDVNCNVFDRTTTGLCVHSDYEGSIVVIGRWK